jgi:hypothetical protein
MPGLLRGVARTAVVAGTASAVGGRVRHRQDQKWARQDAQAAPPPVYAAPAPVTEVPQQRSSAPAKDRLQQLKELGDLKAQGVLTEDEFAREKAKILAG